MINKRDIRCEWCCDGYCKYNGGADAQEQCDIDRSCNGTEAKMLECDQLKFKSNLEMMNNTLQGIELTKMRWSSLNG